MHTRWRNCGVSDARRPPRRDTDATRKMIGAERGSGARDDCGGVDDLAASRHAQTMGTQLPVDARDRDPDRAGACVQDPCDRP